MSSKVSKVKQTNWTSIIPHLIVMGIIIFIWYLIFPEQAMIFGAMTYLLISFLLRTLIPKDHKNGITKINSEKFEEAIPNFEKSYIFFNKYDWIDKYRFVTLLSSSKVCYREMALVNIGFCYSQIGNGTASKAYYKRALKEFPESGMAKSALKMISAMEQKATNL